MYLASGVAPVGEMLKAGITVAIGTDGAGSNNDNDMLEAMKFGALLQKTFHKDPLAMTAGGMLRMATIEGARAAGLGTSWLVPLKWGKRLTSSCLTRLRA